MLPSISRRKARENSGVSCWRTVSRSSNAARTEAMASASTADAGRTVSARLLRASQQDELERRLISARTKPVLQAEVIE